MASNRLHTRLLPWKRRSDRGEGVLQADTPSEGTGDEGATPGSGLPPPVSVRQSAEERKRHNLYDVGGVEGDTVSGGTYDPYELEAGKYKSPVWGGGPLEHLEYPSDVVWTELAIEAYTKRREAEAAAAARKATPVATGVVDYFPDALQEVARCSKIGNDQHNPGEPLHWARGKSTDESDALMRHFIDRGTMDSDGVRHSAKVAWRALALLQKEIENDG